MRPTIVACPYDGLVEVVVYVLTASLLRANPM